MPSIINMDHQNSHLIPLTILDDEEPKSPITCRQKINAVALIVIAAFARVLPYLAMITIGCLVIEKAISLLKTHHKCPIDFNHLFSHAQEKAPSEELEKENPPKSPLTAIPIESPLNMNKEENPPFLPVASSHVQENIQPSTPTLLEPAILPPPIPAAPQVVIETHTAANPKVGAYKETEQQQMFNAIKGSAHPKIAELWEQLFQKADPEIVQSWTCQPDGTFEAKLKRPIEIWISPQDKKDLKGRKDPKGGSILLFGLNENYVIRGKLQPNEIIFKSGFSIYCYHKILVYVSLCPDVFSLEHHDNHVKLTAGPSKSLAEDSLRLFKDLLESWKKGILLAAGEDYKKYLKKKFDGA